MNVFEKIQTDYYKSNIKFPSSSDRPKKDDFIVELQLFDRSKRVVDTIKFEKEFDKWNVEYQKKIAAYNQDLIRCQTEFQTDLFKEYGFKSTKLNQIVYAMAYKQGHSSGYRGVANYFIEFIEFAKEILNVNEKTK